MKKILIKRVVNILLIITLLFVFHRYVEFKKESLEILALGDSLTFGYAVDRPYTEFLENKIDSNVYNWGINSMPFEDIQSTFEEKKEGLKYLDYIILWGGANNIRIEDDLNQMKVKFEDLLSSVEGYSEDIIIINIPPTRNWDEKQNEQVREFNSYLEEKGFHVIDASAMFKDPENENQINPIYEENGIHLTEAGYNLLADEIANYIMSTETRNFSSFLKSF